MKGLLIKDLKILFFQKNFLLTMLFIVGFKLFLKPDPSFVIGYTTMMMLFASMSSLSYDEFDNGYLFLFTLPITRKLYVVEKYLMSLIATAFGWIFSAGLLLMSSAVQEFVFPGEIFLGVIFASIVLLSLILPIQLKFGAEKMRTVFFLLAGGVAVITALALKGAEYFKLDPSKFLKIFASWELFHFIALGVAVLLSVLTLSIRIGVSVMEKKEF